MLTGFVATAKEKETYMASTSGGIFPCLAKWFIWNGGLICAVEFSESDLRHVLTGDMDSIRKMQGSKYVQSDLKSVLPEMEEALESGSTILFVGTPCQVAAIKSKYLKFRDSLILVDLFCHGTVSTSFFKQYLEKTGVDPSSVQNVSFRSKNPFDRSNYTITIETAGEVIKRPESTDLFSFAYKRSASLQEKCYSCKYANTNRVGDISLGDCASRARYCKIAPGRVLSSVLINNEIGWAVWKEVEEHFISAPLIVEEEASLNRALYKAAEKPAWREAFIKDWKTLPVDQIGRKYIKPSANNVIKSVIKHLVPAYFRDVISGLGR